MLFFNSKMIKCISSLSLLIISIHHANSSNHMISNLNSMGFRPEASIMGESALIDKETGRVFWEGGKSNTLFESVEPKVKSYIGIDHLKATILSGLLLLSLLGYISSTLRDKLIQSGFHTPSVVPVKLRMVYFFIIKTMLFIPRFDRWFILFVYIVYLFESYNCSTRQYLMNAINTPEALEDYFERLHDEEPVTEWKVRCFHYETPAWLKPIEIIGNFIAKFNVRSSYNEEYESNSVSIFARKQISNVSKGSYAYGHCKDKTIAAIWKRARASLADISMSNLLTTSSGETDTSNVSVALFTKIMLSKTIVLGDSKSREEYFQQQNNFVAEHAQCDDYAEFSTNIEVTGFKPKILAQRSSRCSPLLKLLISSKFFWIFTLLGLTVPYRRFLADHCDTLRYIIVKETYLDKPSASNGWLQSIPSLTSTPTPDNNTKKFQAVMRNLMQYSTKPIENKESNATAILLKEGIESATIMAELSLLESNSTASNNN